MAIEVKRKTGESAEGMIRRFSYSVTRSGMVQQVKGGRFRNRKPSKRAKKISALRRQSAQVKREYLIKTGALKPQKTR